MILTNRMMLKSLLPEVNHFYSRKSRIPIDPMLIPVRLIPGAISDLFAQVSTTGIITLADRYGLMAAILEEESLSEEERCAIDRLLRAFCRGRMKVVNEISAMTQISGFEVYIGKESY